MTIKRQLPRHRLIVEVSLDNVPEEASLEYEPFTILQNKIEALMELTGGTEEQCEKMVLRML
jgi:hypothetical protein